MQIAPSEDCLRERSERVPQEGAVYLDKSELRILRARSWISAGSVHLTKTTTYAHKNLYKHNLIIYNIITKKNYNLWRKYAKQ